jgi:8-oxo-dGTP diphosphatase
MEEPRVKVGIGVTIFKDGKILLGKRLSAHGNGEYASPGGHLEFGESFEECARRETMEEAGITIKNVRFQFLGNLTDYPGKHYVQVGMVAEWESGEPQVLEPDAYEDWGWYDLDNLPQPLFRTNPTMLESLKTGCNFFDSQCS